MNGWIRKASLATGLAVLGVGAAGVAPAGAIAPPAPFGCASSLAAFTNAAPTAIPTGPAVVTSDIVVAGAGPYLYDVDVVTHLTHTFAADLDVTVESPAGTIVTLTTDNGAGNDNVFNGTTWDDDANPGGQVPYTTNDGLATDHAYVNNVVATPLAPEEPLGAFIGEDPNGTWTITISDDLAGDGGSLDDWQLNLTTLPVAPVGASNTFFNNTPVPTADVGVVTSQINVPALLPTILDLDVRTDLAHTFAADLDITLQSPAGTIVTLTTDNGAGNDNVFNGTVWDDGANPGGQVPYVTDDGLTTDHAYVNNVAASPLAPEEGLGAFIGEDPAGVWTLTVSDDLAGDNGSIDGFGLQIATAVCGLPPTPPPPPPTEPPPPPPVPPTLHDVEVVAGADRVGTAIKVSQGSFANGAAGAVVLARRDDFPDALAGTPLAAAKGGPMLLTSPSVLENDVADEIDRALGGTGDVYLLGGTGALSPAVASALTSSGYTVHRIAGETRFDTAVAIAGELGNPQTVLEASGLNFPDAVSAGAAAIQENAAVLLTNGASQSAATAGYLAANPGATRFAIGGPAAAADPTATGLVGFNRYETSAMVATRFFPTPTVAGVASGVNFPDALTGGVQVGVLGGPMLLTEPGDLPAPVTDFLDANFASISKVFVYGGPAAVGAPVIEEIEEAIS